MSKTWRQEADEEDELPAQSETVPGPTYPSPNDERDDGLPPELQRLAREQRRRD